MLRMLLRRHRPGTRVVQIANAHWEFQRKRLRKAPRCAGPSRLVAAARPPESKLPSQTLRIFLVHPRGACNFKHSRGPPITKHVRSAHQLLQDPLLKIRRLSNNVLRRENTSANEILSQSGHSNLALHQFRQAKKEIIGRLVRILLEGNSTARGVNRLSNPPVRD